MQFLDVGFDLVHLLGETIHAILLTDGVEGHHVMCLLLELLVQGLPLLLEGGNQFLALGVGHQELLAVALVLILDLHLTHQVVLVLDLVPDLGEVLGHGAVVLLLQVVLLLVGLQFGRGKDVLDRVCHDKVLVRNEAVDGLLVVLGDGCLGSSATFILAN